MCSRITNLSIPKPWVSTLRNKEIKNLSPGSPGSQVEKGNVVGSSLSVRTGFKNLGERFPRNHLGEAIFHQVFLPQVTMECHSSQQKRQKKGTEMSPVVKRRHPLGSPWF